MQKCTAAPSLTCESHLNNFQIFISFQCSSTIQLSIKSSVNLKKQNKIKNNSIFSPSVLAHCFTSDLLNLMFESRHKQGDCYVKCMSPDFITYPLQHQKELTSRTVWANTFSEISGEATDRLETSLMCGKHWQTGKFSCFQFCFLFGTFQMAKWWLNKVKQR